MADFLRKFRHKYRVPFQRFSLKYISQQVYHIHVQNDQHLFAMHQVNQSEALHFLKEIHISLAGVSIRVN